MLGTLPQSLDICGRQYAIRSDYRNILQIFSAFNDDDLSDQEKALIFLKRMYVDFDLIPRNDYQAAYAAATEFIECRMPASEKKQPKIIDWDKDEQLIFAAVNKIAGQEIRAVEYMHWWTFLGLFQSIDREDIWGFILTIRQKKARNKKLEKHETEFFNANRALCELSAHTDKKKEAENYMSALFNELSHEGGDG